VRTRIQVVALPSEAEHAPTRKQLLDRTDGVVLVLDARRERLADNLASFEELKSMLAAYGRRIDEMPLVVQYNKRDLADPYALEDLHRKLAMRGATAFEAVAKDGTGVLQTLTTISKRVIRSLRERAQEAEPTPAPAVKRAPVAPSAKPAAASAANAATQARLAPARPAPPPGVTQVLDRAAFEATLAKPAPTAPPLGTTQLLERIVTPEDSQPGVSAPLATFADTVSEAESLFEASFETAKRSPAAAASARPAPKPVARLEAVAEAGAAFTIEPGGPAQAAPGGVRIPLVVRDGSGRRTALTLTLRLESEDA
jgi:hypothetical protein